jgi:hypothetical protein
MILASWEIDKMVKFSRKIIVVLVGFCFASGVFAIDVPLRYVKHPEKPQTFYPYGTSFPEKDLKPPDGEWKFPELKSEHPIYGLIPLGDNKILFVLDRIKTEDPFYNRIYFDANSNKDLTDDPVIDGTSKLVRTYYRVDFTSRDIEIMVEGKKLPFSFIPSLMGFQYEDLKKKGFTQENINRYINFYFRINCSYSGEFKLNGQEYRISLGDRNCNGRFNDRFTLPEDRESAMRYPIYAEGDNIFLTDGEKIESFNSQTCGEYLLIKDRLYTLNINTAKGKMTLTPVTEDLVPLNLAMEVERISLFTEDGKHCLIAYHPGKKIMVPPGKYGFLTYKVYRKDNQGDLWRLIATATKDSPFISVNGGNGSVLKFGEPYVPLVDNYSYTPTSGKLAGKTQYRLMFNAEGIAKEFVVDLGHVSGELTQIPLSETKGSTHLPKEPTYKVVKLDGEVVTQGAFEYG